MDYFCTKAALDYVSRITPESLEYGIRAGDPPFGYILITNKETTYIAKRSDFKTPGTIDNYDDYIAVEYFDNGIPEWLDPLPGISVYLAEYSDGWKFTKVSGI